MSIATKEINKSDREIEGLLFEAEKTVRKVKEPQDDVAIMKNESLIRNSYGMNTLEKCVGKITIGPWCKPETLGALNKANLAPHTILQIETW